MAERIEELYVPLESIGSDLTFLALKNDLNLIYERKEVISQLASLLSNRENSILLVGEPGTGKNAIIEGLARWIAKKQIDFYYTTIVATTIISFQSNCQYVHEFETRIQSIINTLKYHRAILFIDDINLAIGAGAASGAPSRTLANLLNPYLARGGITIVGATSLDGYKSMLKENPVFTARFVRLIVPETSKNETLMILKGIENELVVKYGVLFSKSVFSTLVELSERFYKNRFFPGKAFELLREVMPPKGSDNDRSLCVARVKKEDVYKVVQRGTGLPQFIVRRDKYIKRENITSFFYERIYGQDKAVEEVADVILSFKSEMNDPKRPIAVLFFAGPTGVGKTYLCRLLAEYLFGSEEKLLKYDMAEYSLPTSIENLIGNRRFESNGNLIKDVSANPFSVVLFDEIEKAHQRIFDLLLAVIEDGKLTDYTGRTVNFCNTIIIMTSNLGAELYGKLGIGLLSDLRQSTTEVDVLSKIEEYFRPEFINRLTKIISFKPLSKEMIKMITKSELSKLTKRDGIDLRKRKLAVSDDVLDILIEKGYSVRFGARSIRRIVEQYIRPLIAEAISDGRIKDGTEIFLDSDNKGKIVMNAIQHKTFNI